MANKGGLLSNLGQAVSGYASALSGNPLYLQNSLIMRQAQQQQAQQEQAQRQDQVANIATRSLMTGGSEMTPERKMGMLNLMAPQAMRSALAQQAISQIFPQGPKTQVLKSGETLGNVDAAGNFTPTYTAPAEPKEKALPAEVQLAMFITGGDEKAAREYLKAQAAPKTEGSWRTLTPQEAQQMNLNPSGSYQVNEKGQIQVITQPKQDAPTETQTKYATLATRMGDALSVADKVLKEDPSAISSVLLSATEDLPMGGAAIGRKWSNPNAQILRNSLTDAVDAAITMGTGAAYNQEQLVAKRNSLLPQIGEPAKVKQEKFRKLMVEYEAGKKAARAAGVDLPDAGVFAGLYGIEAGAPSPANNNSDPLGIRGR